MKSKIQEIENNDFILKFIKERNNKGIGTFAICQFKNQKKISFKFDFDFMLTNFTNCELTFDLNKNHIQCYTPQNNISNALLYLEEPITKNKNIINNFDLNLFIEKLGNKKYIFDIIKYNISTEIKFCIQEKIMVIDKNLEFTNSLFPLIKEIESYLNNNKNNILNEKNSNNFKTIKEYKILQQITENLMDKTKRKILDIKNNIYSNKPKYTFEIKGDNYIFKSKANEYILYLYKKKKLEIILNTDNNPIFTISYTDTNYNLYMTINNQNEINLQIIDKFIIYLTDSTSLIGLTCLNLPIKINMGYSFYIL